MLSPFAVTLSSVSWACCQSAYHQGKHTAFQPLKCITFLLIQSFFTFCYLSIILFSIQLGFQHSGYRLSLTPTFLACKCELPAQYAQNIMLSELRFPFVLRQLSHWVALTDLILPVRASWMLGCLCTDHKTLNETFIHIFQLMPFYYSLPICLPITLHLPLP